MPALSRLRALAVQMHSCFGGAVGSATLVPVSAAGGSDGDHEHADWAVPSVPMTGNQGISLVACSCLPRNSCCLCPAGSRTTLATRGHVLQLLVARATR